MFDFITDIRRSVHASTSSSTPWMSNSDLLAEYNAAIAKNLNLLEHGACGSTAREAHKEIAHYRNLRATLLAG
jgi:hypothetical protein